ncbi:DUF2955 domain-containing protein [Thalassobaculum sp.]|uniref:DUF2955 domain-containing protein n=1 Tax=Thalassobaculum sp. TaxID=2022740 RepID=UPI0032ED1918
MTTRHQAYRIAVAASVGLALELLRESYLPPLAPILAVQLLVGSSRPPAARQAFAFVLSVAVVSLGMFWITSSPHSFKGLYYLKITFVYLWIYFLCFNNKTAPIGALALTVAVIVSAVVPASEVTAAGIVAELSCAAVSAVLVAHLAYLVVPSRRIADSLPARPDAGSDGPSPDIFRRSVVATAILVPLQALLTFDDLAPIVALLTTATMLRLADSKAASRYGWTFATGNAIGAIVASANVMLLAMHDEPTVLLTSVAAVSLLFSALLVRGASWTAILLPGLIAYLTLFGLSLSPLPVADDVAVLDRVLTIVAASIYALAGLLLLGRWIAPRMPEART